MSWFTNIFSSGAATVVDSIGNAIDKLVTSDEEKIALRNELMKAQMEAHHKAEELALQMEAQITDRWKSDNEHLVTRLVRPLSYGWFVFLFTIIILGDGNLGGFTIKAAYLPVIETIFVTMTIAYFGGRTSEKLFGKKG